MQSASNFGMSQGVYLVLLQGYEGRGNGFRLDCQRGNNEREHPRRRKLEECHQSRQRLKERGWERIKTVSQNKKRGKRG